MTTTRRTVVAGLAAAPLLSGGVRAAGGPIPVRIGWNPFAGSTPITATLMRGKLFEEEARKVGYEVAPEWLQFVGGAPPANAAMVADRLDLDVDFGSAAMVTRLKQQIPIVIFGVHASHLSNAIVVRPDSGIDSVAKLAGKTVGLPIATSAHYTLASIVKYQTGKSVADLGIRIVNMSVADAIKMPSGIDAGGVWVPFRFMGKALGTAQILADSSGFGGPGSKNPGGRFDDVKQAWGYPEGYLVDRLYLCARAAFAKEHPQLLTAFLRARIRAQEIATADLGRSLAIANEWWKLDPQVAAEARDTYPENTNIRNAPYLLEMDAVAILKASEFFASINTIDGPLTWAEIKPALTPAADVQRKAWEENGAKPGAAAMEANFHGSNPTWPDLNVAGGSPAWTMSEIKDWGERRYKSGPFSG